MKFIEDFNKYATPLIPILDNLAAGHSIDCPLSETNFDIVQAVCLDKSKNKKNFVSYIESDIVYIYRLPDGISRSAFFKSIKAKDETVIVGIGPVTEESNAYKIKTFLLEYLSYDYKQLIKYELSSMASKVKDTDVITKTCLKRRFSNVVSFKNHMKGPSACIDETIDKLISEGVLKKIDEDEMRKKYDVKISAYFIDLKQLKAKLNSGA